MPAKELNLAFKGSFFHVRTNGETYRMAIDNGGSPITFDLSPEDFSSLSDGFIHLREVIKK
jgi:hypothetical protein